MDQMPIEIFVQILGCFDPIHDALIQYSRVCRRWQNTIQSTPALWHHIHIKGIWMYNAERSMLRRCLARFRPFIRCVRVNDYHNDVFLDVSMRDLLRDLPSLLCLDVPLLLWDPQLLESFQSAEHLQELNLYGFGNSETKLWPSLIHDPQPPFLLSQDHFQILLRRFRALRTLKFSLNMFDLSQLDVMAFLDGLRPRAIQVTAFAQSYSGSSLHFIGVTLIRHLLSSVHAASITALQLHDVAIGHKETRLIIKNLPALRKLHLVFDTDRVCRNPYQFLHSHTLRMLILDGLPAVYIKYLRFRMPSLIVLKLSKCELVISATVSAPLLEILHTVDIPKLRNLQVDSVRLKEWKLWKCRAMIREARFTKFLERHPQITNLKIYADIESLNLFENICGSLTVLDMQVKSMNKFSDFKIECLTLKSFRFRGNPLAQARHGVERKPRSISISGDVLERVDIVAPGISTLSVQCRALHTLTVNTENRIWDEVWPGLDFHVLVSETLQRFTGQNCRFCRFRIDCRNLLVVQLMNCEFMGPLELRSYYTDELKVTECREVTALQIETTSLYTGTISLAHCERLRRLTFDVIVYEKGENNREDLDSSPPLPQLSLGPSCGTKKDGNNPASGNSNEDNVDSSSSQNATSSFSSDELRDLCLNSKRTEGRHLMHVKVDNCASFWLSDKPFQERLIRRNLAGLRIMS